MVTGHRQFPDSDHPQPPVTTGQPPTQQHLSESLMAIK
nr:MAG TPA: hypothetical protein [Caudoviricetes sp.]